VTPLNFGGFRITARRATASGVFTKPYRNMPALSQIFTGQRTCLAPKPRGFQIHATKHSVMNIYISLEFVCGYRSSYMQIGEGGHTAATNVGVTWIYIPQNWDPRLPANPTKRSQLIVPYYRRWRSEGSYVENRHTQ
jgi:hypothetical protein